MGLFDKIKTLIDQHRGQEGAEYYEEDEDEEVFENEDTGEFPEPADLDQPPAYTFMEAMRAAGQGDTARIGEYLAFNKDYARCRDWDGNTLLHRAALFARADTVERLLQHGAPVDLRYKHKTPLHYAIGTDELWVKSKKKDVDWEQHQAQQAATVEMLLAHGASCEAADEQGETPLHTAARLGHAALAELLLQQGAPVDLRAAPANTPENGRSPLLFVARYTKNGNIMKFLLEKGADPNAQDQDPGYTCLHYLAVAPFFPEADKEKLLAALALLLLKYQANPNRRSAKQNMPLHMAAANNHVLLAETLLNHGAEINAVGDRDMTPMGIAASRGSVEMVECLLRHGVDLYASRALYHAAYCKHSDAVLKLLIERGADPNRPDNLGMTALFAAIAANSLRNVKFLLEHGADTKIHPPGRTVLQHAFANWGAIEAMPEKERNKYADDARGIIEVLGGFKGYKLKTTESGPGH